MLDLVAGPVGAAVVAGAVAGRIVAWLLGMP